MNTIKILLTLSILIFSGCSYNSKFAATMTKAELNSSISSDQKYIDKEILKSKQVIFDDSYFTTHSHDDYRNYTIDHITELINKISIYLYNDDNVTRADQRRFTKIAEESFLKATQEELVCRSPKDLTCYKGEIDETACYLGRNIPSSQLCSPQKYNIIFNKYGYGKTYKAKWSCRSHLKQFDKEEKHRCNYNLFRYLFLFKSMSTFYGNLQMYKKQQQVTDSYYTFIEKYKDRYPTSLKFYKDNAKYVFEYGILMQLANRDVLSAMKKAKELDTTFLPRIEAINATQGKETEYDIRIYRSALVNREAAYSNIFYTLKHSEKELLNYVNETNRYGKLLGWNYYSIHKPMSEIAMRQGYTKLAEELFKSSMKYKGDDLIGIYNDLYFKRMIAMNENRWNDALKITDDLDSFIKSNKIFVDKGPHLRTKSNIYLHVKQYNKAITFANESIAIAEINRNQSNSKINFFNNTNAPTYKVLIKSRYGAYSKTKSSDDFVLFLKDVENLRSRTLKDIKGVSSSIDITAIQNGLTTTDIILGYIDVDEYYLAYFITKNGFDIVKINNRTKINQLIYTIKDALQDPSSNIMMMNNQLMELSSFVIAPFKKELKLKKRMYLLTDGNLNFIPFDVLTSDSKKYNPIINALTITMQPYISSVKKNKKISNSFIAIANPHYNKSNSQNDIYFMPLPETYNEVKDISRYFPRKKYKIISGKKATLKTVKSTNFSPYGYVHFATHGVLGYEVPGVIEPSLVLK